MRAIEFIVEDKKGKLTQNQQDSLPDAQSMGVKPDSSGPTNFYWKYRTGLAASFSPDHNDNFNPGGPANDDMIMIGYSKADQDIIKAARKRMGYKTNKLSSHGSKESSDVHVTSPISTWNKK
jgi:hypothetical protein